MQTLGIPVDDTPGLLFLTTAGVGLCAVLVDFVAVRMRRPALAGLPMLAIYAVPVAIDPSTASRSSRSRSARSASCGCWSPTTSTGYACSAAGSPATGRGVDMWEPSPLAAVGRRIAVVGVLLAIIAAGRHARLDQRAVRSLGQRHRHRRR